MHRKKLVSSDNGNETPCLGSINIMIFANMLDEPSSSRQLIDQLLCFSGFLKNCSVMLKIEDIRYSMTHRNFQFWRLTNGVLRITV